LIGVTFADEPRVVANFRRRRNGGHYRAPSSRGSSSVCAADICLVLTTYVQDQEGLGQRLLSLQAEEIGEAIIVEDSHARFDPALLYREPIGSARLAFAIYDQRGQEFAVEGLPELTQALTPPTTSTSSETRREARANGFLLHGTRRVIAVGQPFWVAMSIEGSGLRPFWPVILNEMIDHVALPLTPLALLLLFLNVAVVRRALRPLSTAVSGVESLDAQKVERRLSVPKTPSEVRQLVGAMNEALGRIESAIHALRDFAADAAHELRTPLAIMSLEVEQLPAGLTRQKLLEDIASMTRLVRQMLDMAAADALLIPEGATADLGAIGADVASQLTPLAVREGRSIRFVDDNAPIITGHAEAISRAVRNLVENAMAYTPAGTSVEITAGPGAVIAVRDHGAGIPIEKRDNVLKRFWRGNRSRGPGSGLGLAIASRIAEAHGGRIEVENADDGGAVIRLRFPSAQRVEAPDNLSVSTRQ
jgi:two-component system OmpR family sensor kinase